MKNHRLFIWAFAILSCVTLTGFESTSKHTSTVSSTTHQNTNKAGASLLSNKAKQETQLPLDLSIPFSNAPSSEPQLLEGNEPPSIIDSLFTPKAKTDDQALRLKGGWLMSPEPEPEKKKTVDGAGIVIDLKP